MQPSYAEPDDPESIVLPARIVARVRIPSGFAFDLIRMIHATMEVYEAEWGEIRPPEPEAPEEA